MYAFKIHYLIFSLQDSILGQILLNIFINDLDKGAGHTLSGFAAVTKVAGLIDTPDACAAIQWHVNRLQEFPEAEQRGDAKSCLWGGRDCGHSPIQTGECLAGKQLCSKGPEGPDGHQVEHEPLMCPCGTDDQQHPGCTRGSFDTRSREVDESSLLSPG